MSGTMSLSREESEEWMKEAERKGEGKKEDDESWNDKPEKDMGNKEKERSTPSPVSTRIGMQRENTHTSSASKAPIHA